MVPQIFIEPIPKSHEKNPHMSLNRHEFCFFWHQNQECIYYESKTKNINSNQDTSYIASPLTPVPLGSSPSFGKDGKA